MSVYTTQSYVRYQGDGIQRRFPISFTYLSLQDIYVFLIEGGTKIVLQYKDDYNIEEHEGGANIILSQAPSEESIIVIERRQQQTQEVHLHANSTLDLSVLERSLDALVLMVQEASQQIQKLQENGELPKAEEYKRLHTYITSSVHTIEMLNTTIKEKYDEIVAIYDAIKKIENNGGGSSGGETENSSIMLIEHDMNKEAHAHRLIPTGCIAYFMMRSAPQGWLILEKKVYKRSEYPALAELIYCGNEANGSAEYGYYCTDPDNPEESRNIGGEYFMLGPDVRGEFIRALDYGRGIDTERILGSMQEAAIPAHSHDLCLYSTNLGRGSMKVYTESLGEVVQLTTNDGGGKENYPRNIAFLVCIKY